MCVCVILFSHLVTPLLFLLLFPSCRREKTTLARSSHKNFVFRFWRKPSLLLPFAIIIVVGHCCCRAGIFGPCCAQQVRKATGKRRAAASSSSSSSASTSTSASASASAASARVRHRGRRSVSSFPLRSLCHRSGNWKNRIKNNNLIYEM